MRCAPQYTSRQASPSRRYLVSASSMHEVNVTNRNNHSREITFSRFLGSPRHGPDLREPIIDDPIVIDPLKKLSEA